MRAPLTKALALTFALSGCTRPAPPQSFDASAIAMADAGAAPIACAIRLDPEMVHDQIIQDPCFENFFGACRSDCIQTCTTCGEGCTTAECRTTCLTARDHCARDHDGHCASAYLECRTKLVGDWLKDGCDAVCAPFRRCPECDAGVTKSCIPARCDAMQSAPERKILDPKWKGNHCDAVCAKIWSCAETECEKSGCIEPIKKYEACALRTPGSAACALQGSASTLLCKEPQR